jgi:hypothetical protein
MSYYGGRREVGRSARQFERDAEDEWLSRQWALAGADSPPPETIGVNLPALFALCAASGFASSALFTWMTS